MVVVSVVVVEGEIVVVVVNGAAVVVGAGSRVVAVTAFPPQAVMAMRAAQSSRCVVVHRTVIGNPNDIYSGS